MLFGIATDLKEISTSLVDGIELRLDLFKSIDLEEICYFIKKCPKPVLLTYPEGDLTLLARLFALKPQFIDLDWKTDRSFVEWMTFLYPEVKMICSYHNFTETPLELEEIVEKMFPCYAYKMATFANSSLDALRMFLFTRKKTAEGVRVSGIGMGDLGQLTRILGPVCGNFIDYAPLGESVAPGQLSLTDLLELYHYRRLSPTTPIYALMGQPLVHVLSHIGHNAAIQNMRKEGIYIKIPLLPSELKDFFPLAKEVGVLGISVTMPLKEEVLPFLDHVDAEATAMGAVNTITLVQDHYWGCNTDGDGAMDALEKWGSLKGKKVILVGAGGAAKAIGHAVQKRGANIVILNRTLEKALKLAEGLGGVAGSLEKMEKEFEVGYDVLINCTPDYLPFPSKYLLEDALIMDIKAYPREGSLLEFAKNRVEGYEMFVYQALRQEMIWFQESDELAIRKAILPFIISDNGIKSMLVPL